MLLPALDRVDATTMNADVPARHRLHSVAESLVAVSAWQQQRRRQGRSRKGT
jgi:hypothetical protein